MDNKRLTFKDLINKKIKLEDSKIAFKDIYISKIEGSLLFKVPKAEEVLDIVDKIRVSDGSARITYEEYKKLIYLCCETLQNQELHNEYEINDPFDIVEMFITPEQVMEIGNELSALAGISNSNVEEDIKN